MPAEPETDTGQPPTLAEYVDRFFEKFDADVDEAITLEEMLAVLDPQQAHRGFDKHLARVFAEVDTDADQALSRTELEDAIAHLDASQDGKPDDVPGRLHATTVQLVAIALRPEDKPPEEPAQPTLADYVDAFVAKFDADADEAITLEEMLAVLDPQQAHRGFDKHLARVFAEVDTDADQALSRTELEDAIAHLDASQDGKPDDVPGRLHATTVELVAHTLTPEFTPGHGG